jgi:hypothetical protein
VAKREKQTGDNCGQHAKAEGQQNPKPKVSSFRLRARIIEWLHFAPLYVTYSEETPSKFSRRFWTLCDRDILDQELGKNYLAACAQHRVGADGRALTRCYAPPLNKLPTIARFLHDMSG